MKSKCTELSQRKLALIASILLVQSIGHHGGCHGWTPSRLISRTSIHSQVTPRVSELPSTVNGFLSRKTKRLRSMGRRIISSSSSSRSSSSQDELDLSSLQSENSLLRDTIRQLEDENSRLRQRADRMLGLENFEGGDRYFRDEPETAISSMIGGESGGGITLSGEEIGNEELWCDTLEGGKKMRL